MKIHHLGVACADIQESLEGIRKIFRVLSESEVIFDPEQNAHLCIVTVEGGPAIELVSGAMVERLLKKGVSLYHTCWEVPDIRAEIDRLLTAGCTLLSEPKKAVLFGGREVAFLMSSAGIIELLAP